jgi:hypothetical protein
MNSTLYWSIMGFYVDTLDVLLFRFDRSQMRLAGIVSLSKAGWRPTQRLLNLLPRSISSSAAAPALQVFARRKFFTSTLGTTSLPY